MKNQESVAEYLARGGRIKKVPRGVSGESKKKYGRKDEFVRRMRKGNAD